MESGEESIKVYRACRSGKCDRLSFLPSFEENGFVVCPFVDTTDPGQYSLLTFEKPTDVKRFAGVVSDMKVPYQIAFGETNPRHGLVQRTRERTKERTSHVDWWLYIDRVLFESYFPIIFTCVNDNKDVFIVVCCQSNEKGCKWLLGKTSGMSIVRVLRDEMTIRQLLLECSSEKISVDYLENEYMVAYNNSDWDEDSPYLPKEDFYMYAEDGEFEDEIAYFLSLDYRVHYSGEYYKCITDAIEMESKEIESMANTITLLGLTIENISIPSEIVNTLKVFGELCTNLVIDTEKYTDTEKYKSIYSDTFNVLSGNLSIKVESDNNYADAA